MVVLKGMNLSFAQCSLVAYKFTKSKELSNVVLVETRLPP